MGWDSKVDALKDTKLPVKNQISVRDSSCLWSGRDLSWSLKSPDLLLIFRGPFLGYPLRNIGYIAHNFFLFQPSSSSASYLFVSCLSISRLFSSIRLFFSMKVLLISALNGVDVPGRKMYRGHFAGKGVALLWLCVIFPSSPHQPQ